MQSCSEPAFADEPHSNDGNMHGTTVGTSPENAIIPIGHDLEAWIENDHLPEELLKTEELHYCEAEKDYYMMRLDESEAMPYRLSASVESGYEAKPFCVQPGSHSIELEHCINYCFHGLDKYGSPICLGNNQYKLRGSRKIAVVEISKLTGPNSFVVERPNVETLLSESPFLDISKTLSLPLGCKGDTVEFKAVPYPSGPWPDKCPDWLVFGCEHKIDGDKATVATDKPFWDTVTALCGMSYIRIALAVVGVDTIVPGKITKDTSNNHFDECGAYPYEGEDEKYLVMDVNTKKISVKAIPSPDVAGASSSDVASYTEALLPEEWSFTCNGKEDRQSRLFMTTDISNGGKFSYEAKCGSSSKKLTVYSSGATILTKEPGGDCQGITRRPDVIFVPVPEQEGKHAFDKELLVPITLHPIHLMELDGLPVSHIDDEEYALSFSQPSGNMLRPATSAIYNYGELKVKYAGKIKLWHDIERTKPCKEEETIPIDRDTVVYAEGVDFKSDSGCESAQISLEYESIVFNCIDEMPVTVLDLRPSVQFKYLLINNDNDDMGDIDATVPKDHESDLMQSYVENEDDLKPILFKCPLVSPSLFKDYPPIIELQAYQEDTHPFELWSHPEKVSRIFFMSHLFDLHELSTEEDSKRVYNVYVEGCDSTGAEGSEVIAEWYVHGQSFTYFIPLITINMRMAVDNGKHIISENDEDASINFDDFGSDKDGDFGSYRCVFWVNNDCDCIHWETDRPQSMGWHEDDFGNNVNCLDDTIGCRLLFTNGFHRLTDILNYSINDLEDFNRLHILLDPTFQKISQNGTFFEFSIYNAPINIFQALRPGLGYLKSTTEANAQAKLRRLLELTPTTGKVIPGKHLKFDGSISPFIWEGCAPGIYDLELSVSAKSPNAKTSEFIGTRRVRLVLREISDFYDTWNADSPNVTPKQNFQDGTLQTDEYILFVHGFNVLNSEKLFWPGTMHKRLWWNGYRGRTGILTWDCSLVNITKDLGKLKFNLHVYDQSEFKAWQTGATLKEVLLRLQNHYGNSKVSILAHSQGNIVACEALRLLPEGNTVHTYIASQGAISSSYFQHIDKPYFLEKEYRKKEHGFVPWLVTPDIFADYPGWNLLSPREHPTYLHSMLSTPKASKMINYFNPDDWALTGAMETSWEDNNAMKPNLGYGYAGDKTFYNVFLQYKLNFFYKGHLAQSGTVLKFPAMSDNHCSARLEDSYTIFSFIAQAWGPPIGTNDKTTCFNKNINLKDINFWGDHYSHSKQFRSNIQTMGAYWKMVLDDCNL